MAGKFRKLLHKISKQDMSSQKKELTKEFYEWKSGLPQVDDVLVVGLLLD